MYDEQEIIRRYQAGHGVHKLKREMNLSSYRVVYKILKKNNIEARKYDGIDEDKLLELYNSGITSTIKLAKIFNLPKVNIEHYFRKYKLKSITKRDDVDEDFFENINTEEKAYCLGLLYSDGCIHNLKSIVDGKEYRNLTCCLMMSDRDVIEKVAQALKYTGTIKITKPTNPKHKTLYGVRIMSVKMASDLINKGCVPRKSAIITFPYNIIPENLIHHFVRGVFDGDGGISMYQNGQYNIYITGTQMLMQGIQKYLPCRSGLSKYKNSYVYQLYISSKLAKKEFLEWLYKDATIYMNRKHKKAQEFLSKIK